MTSPQDRTDAGETAAEPLHAPAGERRLTLFAALYFFFLMASYYALRPVRDSFGSGNTDELHWLFTGTFVATLIAQPLYGYLVARTGRSAFIPIAYRFLIAGALTFAVLLSRLEGSSLQWVQRGFFVWLSLYIVMGVSVFWGFMADVMGSERAKRLFGKIALGGSLGAIFGSLLAGWLVDAVAHLGSSSTESKLLDVTILLPVSAALLLEGAVRAARAVERSRLTEDAPAAEHVDAAAAAANAAPSGEAPVGGTALAGFGSTLRSPYLLGICLYVLIFVVGSTMLYKINTEIVNAAYPDAGERTQFFGRVDLVANTLTLVLQLLVTGQVMRRFGLGVALAAVPLVSFVGFGAIAIEPTITACALLFVSRRAFEFAFSKPGRDALFTVVPREDKYKAKAVIDAVIYRGGDALSLWSREGLLARGVSVPQITRGLVPLAGLGILLAFWLGRQHRRRETEPAPPS